MPSNAIKWIAAAVTLTAVFFNPGLPGTRFSGAIIWIYLSSVAMMGILVTVWKMRTRPMLRMPSIAGPPPSPKYFQQN